MSDAASHPHDLQRGVPDRISHAELVRLSVVSPWRALSAIALEWIGIALAIAIATSVSWWPVTVLAVIYIGARQHALMVIAHDAAHFRLLPGRALNDWIGNVFLAWPTFISVQGFRHFHGEHHRHLNQVGDGNRVLWRTHDASGELTPEWRYPKSAAGLAWKLLRRVVSGTGLLWILRGVIGAFLFGGAREHVVRMTLWAALFVLLSYFHAWMGFLTYWVVPYCTWQIAAQYIRLICEHSAIEASDPHYADTRTTVPGVLGRLFILPRNIGYHIEHHWYPSVPFYRLPELHKLLLTRPAFASEARYTTSIAASLRECVSRASSSWRRANGPRPSHGH